MIRVNKKLPVSNKKKKKYKINRDRHQWRDDGCFKRQIAFGISEILRSGKCAR